MEQIEDPAFTIRIDAARKYVEIGMLGLWDDVIAKRFERELRCLLPACQKGDAGSASRTPCSIRPLISCSLRM
jgi:hypothetical protein